MEFMIFLMNLTVWKRNKNMHKHRFNILKTIFIILLVATLFYAVFNIMFSILLPYRSLKKNIDTDFSEQGTHVINIFDLYIDMLNGSYSSISYDLFNKNEFLDQNIMDNPGYLAKLCQREIIAANIIESVCIYDPESRIYYDYLTGLNTMGGHDMNRQFPSGFSRYNDLLFYTGVADLYTDTSLVVSFQINERLLESFVFDNIKTSDTLCAVTDISGNRVIGDYIDIKDIPYEMGVQNISIASVDYFMKRQKSSEKGYQCLLLIPETGAFEEIDKRIAVISVSIFILVVLLIVMYRVLFVKTTLKVYFRITGYSLSVDDLDYSALLSDGDLKLLYLFACKDNLKINCSEIQHELTGILPSACHDCRQNSVKATMCPAYKKTYNQILKIKKTIETLKIGTIIPPQNKLDILKEGWTLNLYNNICLIRDDCRADSEVVNNT